MANTHTNDHNNERGCANAVVCCCLLFVVVVVVVVVETDASFIQAFERWVCLN
jgi:hypothetical protein